MANTDEDSWDENAPLLTDPRRDGALEILSLRQAVGKRVAKEHVDPAAAGVGGEHLEGSARGYYETTAPTNKPDGATPLDAADQGRLWADSDDTDRTLSMWTGTVWEEISKQAAVPFTQADIEHDEANDDINTAFKSIGGYENVAAKAQLVVWSYGMSIDAGGAVPNVEYDPSGGGSFEVLQVPTSAVKSTVTDTMFSLQGSFILNPGDKIRLSITAGFTIKEQSARKQTFLV